MLQGQPPSQNVVSFKITSGCSGPCPGEFLVSPKISEPLCCLHQGSPSPGEILSSPTSSEQLHGEELIPK